METCLLAVVCVHIVQIWCMHAFVLVRVGACMSVDSTL